MAKNNELTRYSIINQKNQREMVMLLGTGCGWRRCRFCDYHLDYETSKAECYKTNAAILAKVTGQYGKLEVINSGSFTELDADSVNLIEKIAVEKQIREIYFECHYRYRHQIPAFRQRFQDKGIQLKIKCGVETFDSSYRERILDKGMPGVEVEDIKQDFDQVCLLFGLTGQTEQSMRQDIAIGLAHFERICINIMQTNTAALKPDQAVVDLFRERIYPELKADTRIDILLENTDFGVGAVERRYYIAYGSNMDVAQMAIRCPQATLIGTTVLADYKLVFRGQERYYADIEPQSKAKVPVLLWQISETDEQNLDAYESYPELYRKLEVAVKWHGQKIKAMVYRMNQGRYGQPAADYLERLQMAYQVFGFDLDILEQAQSTIK